MPSRRSRTLWTVAAIVALGCALQADLFAARKPLDVLRNSDEAWYALTLKAVAVQGCRGVPVSFLYGDRPNFHSCEFLRLLRAASPFSDVLRSVAWLKVMARLITLLLLAGISWLVVRSVWPGLLICGWYFVDSGLDDFKPALGLLKELVHGPVGQFVHSSRFISPLHYVLPGMALVAVFLGALRLEDENRLDPRRGVGLAALAGISAVVLSLVPFYAWLPFGWAGGSLLLFAVLRRYRLSTAIMAIGLVTLGAGIVIGLRAHTHFPYADDVLARSGFVRGFYDPLYLAHKAFWVTCVLTGLVAYLASNRRLIFAGLVAGSLVLLLNVNMLTGIDYQNFHFKAYLGLLCFAALFLCAWWYVPKVRVPLAVGSTILILVGTVETARRVRKADNELTPIASRTEANAVFEYARTHLSNAKLYCGEWYQTLPLLTNARCDFHHLLMTYPLSDQEVMSANMVQFKLLGFSSAQVERALELAARNRAIATWNFGVDPGWLKGVPTFSRYSEANLARIIPLWVRAYQEFSLEKVRALLVGYDAFILRTENPITSELFVPVENLGTYGVFRLKGGPASASIAP